MRWKNYSELVKELVSASYPLIKSQETLQRLGEIGAGFVLEIYVLFSAPRIDWAPREKMWSDVDAGHVRIALRRHILRRLYPEGKPLPILRIGEGLEDLVRESIRHGNGDLYCAVVSS